MKIDYLLLLELELRRAFTKALKTINFVLRLLDIYVRLWDLGILTP
jgi:hypothetical protein